jgi:PEGA domain-containing protein
MRRSLFAAALIGIAALAAPRPATAQHTAPAGSTSSGSAVPSGGGSSSGSSSSGSSGGSSSSSGSSGGSVDSGGSGRQRGSSPVSGRAIPRSSQPGGGGAIAIGSGGFYPWGYAGAGGGIYDGFYGGYYGAYDPWYGFSPIYAPSSYSHDDSSGSIRLRVKPSNAAVYVDGYYAGVVDDFDGTFQRLHLEPGPHHLEIRAADYTALSLDVWITEGLTINYRGELGKQ